MSKTRSQLQMCPDEQGTADKARDGRGPRSEPLPGFGIPGDQPLVEARDPHRSPFVMVIFEPEVGKRLVHPVRSDVLRRKVVVQVEDRSTTSDLVEQLVSRLAGQKVILVEEAARATGMPLHVSLLLVPPALVFVLVGHSVA